MKPFLCSGCVRGIWTHPLVDLGSVGRGSELLSCHLPVARRMIGMQAISIDGIHCKAWRKVMMYGCIPPFAWYKQPPSLTFTSSPIPIVHDAARRCGITTPYRKFRFALSFPVFICESICSSGTQQSGIHLVWPVSPRVSAASSAEQSRQGCSRDNID